MAPCGEETSPWIQESTDRTIVSIDEVVLRCGPEDSFNPGIDFPVLLLPRMQEPDLISF